MGFKPDTKSKFTDKSAANVSYKESFGQVIFEIWTRSSLKLESSVTDILVYCIFTFTIL